MNKPTDILFTGKKTIHCGWCKVVIEAVTVSQTSDLYTMTCTCQKCGRHVYILYEKEPRDRPERF